MVNSVPITRETAAQYQTQNVQYATGPAQALRQTGDQLAEMSIAVQKQAQKKALLDYSVGMKQEIFRIEQENIGEPERLRASLENFKKGYLGKIDDEEMGGLLNKQFEDETQPIMRRALKTKQDRLDNEIKTQALVTAGLADQRIENALPGLFDADAGAATEARKDIEAQAFTIQNVIDLKDAEGNPMFTPEKQAELSLKMRELQGFLSQEGVAPGQDGAIETVLANEGGFTAQDGASGAPAIYGINGKWHPEAFAEAKRISDEKGEAAGKEYAREFYKREYWDKYKIAELPAETQAVVMDGVVNHTTAFAKKLIEAAKGGETPEALVEMRRAEYQRLAKQNPAKYGQSLQAWENRLGKVSGALPNSLKKAFQKKLDGELAADPGKFLQRMQAGAFDQYMDAPTRQKYLKEAGEMFKDAEERARITRIAGQAAADRAIYDQFLSGAPDLLQKIEDYRGQGGDAELADYMRRNYLKANPVSADEQGRVYSEIVDQVAQLGIRTVKGKVKIENDEATLEDMVRLQQRILKESARGVTGLTSWANKLAPAVLEKAKKERGKDDLGIDSLFGFFRTTEAYDPGYTQIQKWLEGQSKEENLALKAEMMRELVARADAIPEEIQGDEALFKQTQEAIARDVIARQAVKGMRNVPIPAAQHLIANPSTAAQFDEIFGAGAANGILGKQ